MASIRRKSGRQEAGKNASAFELATGKNPNTFELATGKEPRVCIEKLSDEIIRSLTRSNYGLNKLSNIMNDLSPSLENSDFDDLSILSHQNDSLKKLSPVRRSTRNLSLKDDHELALQLASQFRKRKFQKPGPKCSKVSLPPDSESKESANSKEDTLSPVTTKKLTSLVESNGDSSVRPSDMEIEKDKTTSETKEYALRKTKSRNLKEESGKETGLNRSRRLVNSKIRTYEEISDKSSSDDDEIVFKRSMNREKSKIDDSSFEELSDTTSGSDLDFQKFNISGSKRRKRKGVTPKKRADATISSKERESKESSPELYIPTKRRQNDENKFWRSTRTTPVKKDTTRKSARFSLRKYSSDQNSLVQNENPDTESHNIDKSKEKPREKVQLNLRRSSSPQDFGDDVGVEEYFDYKYEKEATPRSNIVDRQKMSKINVEPNELLRDWNPIHFLQCHSKNNDVFDEMTQVWHCSFSPSLPDVATKRVATCGGSTVCLIDCDTGDVINRYKYPYSSEEFFVLAWSTISLDKTETNLINVLAVAGRRGVVHLLQPDQLICYAKLTGHTDMISALAFHQQEPTILCSGSADGTIIIWDIGIPSGPNFQTEYKQLKTLKTEADILSIAFVSHFDYILCGTAQSCWGWFYSTKNIKSVQMKPNVEFLHPSKQSGSENVVVDSVVLVTDSIIASKCVGHQCIYLWDFDATISSTVKKLINGHGLKIQILAILNWSNVDDVYIKLGIATNIKTLVCGDTNGRLWLYPLQKFLQSTKITSDLKINPLPPIEWPRCITDSPRKRNDTKNVVVNCVTFSPDATYLVAVTDKNIVCIWS